ncbi:sulfotransferase family protein [Oceanicoccus sagamiensis]|uniref:Sulfotransferase domain-containing protein n=1 Tax=Oceanicoccus sagamiensis TaxID=716816 RepID=A0A1X9N6Z6_9GAMM|nr:hypothetical protein [Oceanicoccus sagamiensis]ARN73868.1 hypothetical protein BST96_06920 [Oceanicoccus sagamiensis]
MMYHRLLILWGWVKPSIYKPSYISIKSPAIMELICGMHRCGTSLVARLLKESGGKFGDEAGFYAPDNWNPDGYFEQREIIAVNRNIQNGMLGRFHYFFLPSSTTILNRGQKNHTELVSLIKEYKDAMVKENRFCLTLPAWIEAGLSVKKLLIVFRHPKDVAKSLYSRNKIPSKLAYHLYHEHFLRLEAASKHIPKTYLWYDALISQPQFMEQEVNKLSSFSGLPRETIHLAASNAINLRDQPPLPLLGSLPPKMAALYSDMIQLSKSSPQGN